MVRTFAFALAVALGAALPISVSAQTAPDPGVEQPAKPARSGRGARANREPTAGQMAARERQRKCGVEWKDAKAAGKTDGLKWPQYWSRCNARLKGNSA